MPKPEEDVAAIPPLAPGGGGSENDDPREELMPGRCWLSESDDNPPLNPPP
jgi:hypothetical protein